VTVKPTIRRPERTGNVGEEFFEPAEFNLV
jgi:hypothetical protein